MRIAVAGGTGAVGRRVVEEAGRAGHGVVVLSRSSGVDLMTGDGLVAALDGAEAVIDVAATSGLAAAGAIRFFGTATSELLAAEREVGVPHHVALSIVGAAAIDSGYYAGKAVQERTLMALAGGWTLLRTTQFHEFAQQTYARPHVAGIVIAPQLRSQPIAAAEVTAELVLLAAGAPRGLVPDMAGPREEYMPDLVRRYARALGRRNPVLGVPLPGRMGRAMRDGGLLAPSDARRGTQTFDGWLDAVVAGRAASGRQ